MTEGASNVYDPSDIRHRRYAIVYIPERELMAILKWYKAPEGSCIRIAGAKVPEDARLMNIFVDHTRNSLGIIIAHESFDEVPLGHEYPVLIGELEIIQLKPPVVSLSYEVNSPGDQVPSDESPSDFFRRVMGTNG
jgi:hypothetical protein